MRQETLRNLKFNGSRIIKARGVIVKIKLKYSTFFIYLEDELERISQGDTVKQINEGEGKLNKENILLVIFFTTKVIHNINVCAYLNNYRLPLSTDN